MVYDLTRDAVNEIILGRSDGRVEIYVQTANGVDAPLLVFCRDIGESIQSIDAGIVSTCEYTEVLLATYSGKIISYTSEPVHARSQEDPYGRSVQTVNNENRIKFLRKELDGLKQRVDKEKDKLKKNASNGPLTTAIRPFQDFPVISRFLLDPSHSAYTLSVELQSPIDLVVLRSAVSLEIVEFSEIGTAVASVTPPHLLSSAAGEDGTNKFMASFRCQGQEKRLSVMVRTTEGELGDISVTIVCAAAPKSAKSLKLAVKPLSLHARVHDLTQQELDRPRCRIRFSGPASLLLLHEWLQTLFPDLPPHLDESMSDLRYLFKNVCTDGVTIVEARKNEILFESESASVICIVKENITRLANYRRLQLEESLSTNEASIPSFLALLWPRLEHQLSLAKKMDILDVLTEITMQEPDPRWLSAEYAAVVRDSEQIRREFKARAKSLEYLTGVLTDLFVDWQRLRGSDGRARIPELHQAILAADATLAALVAVFLASTRGRK